MIEYFGGTCESAKSDERKEFQKMLNYVKRRINIGYIIVYSYDRFSRTDAIPGEIIERNHPPLISRDIFLKIHNLLKSGETRKYSFDDENLPLKTFLKSTVYGTPYTGYIVKKKGIYYYKNRRKGSKENRNAKKLHQEFLALLEHYTLKDEKYIPPLKEIIYDSFVSMNEEAIKETQYLNKEIKALEVKLDRLEERFVF